MNTTPKPPPRRKRKRAPLDALTPAEQRRFWTSMDMLADDHWVWASPGRGGYAPQYPLLKLDNGEYVPAAHAALLLAGTPLPPMYNVRYLCLGGSCINPKHNSIYNRRTGPWNYLGRPKKKTVQKRWVPFE